jgi:hypothetical protein
MRARSPGTGNYWLDFSCVLAHRLIRHDKTLGLADAFAGIATLWTDQH